MFKIINFNYIYIIFNDYRNFLERYILLLSKKTPGQFFGTGVKQPKSGFPLLDYMKMRIDSYSEYKVFHVNNLFKFFGLNPTMDSELSTAVKNNKLDYELYKLVTSNNRFLKNFFIHGTYIQNMGLFNGKIWFTAFAITQREATVTLYKDEVEGKPLIIHLKDGRILYVGPFAVTFEVDPKDANLSFFLDMASKKNCYDLGYRTEIGEQIKEYYSKGFFREVNINSIKSIRDNVYNIIDLTSNHNLNEDELNFRVEKIRNNIKKDSLIDYLVDGDIKSYNEKNVGFHIDKDDDISLVSYNSNNKSFMGIDLSEN